MIDGVDDRGGLLDVGEQALPAAAWMTISCASPAMPAIPSPFELEPAASAATKVPWPLKSLHAGALVLTLHVCGVFAARSGAARSAPVSMTAIVTVAAAAPPSGTWSACVAAYCHCGGVRRGDEARLDPRVPGRRLLDVGFPARGRAERERLDVTTGPHLGDPQGGELAHDRAGWRYSARRRASSLAYETMDCRPAKRGGAAGGTGHGWARGDESRQSDGPAELTSRIRLS